MCKQSLGRILVTPATILLMGAFTSILHAQCGVNLKTFKPAAVSQAVAGARLVQAAFQPEDRFAPRPSIVGMWRATFTARTMNGNPIPDTVIDNALVVWHEDKTEIMNSGRPPQDGNFCLGVWEEVAPRTYQLNHFAWGANGFAPGTPDGIVGQPIGPVHYREVVRVGPEDKHYAGSFSLDQYDTTGKIAVAFTGTLKATRITVDTTVRDLQ